MTGLIFFFFCLLSAQAADLRFLTWNTFMLPKPIKFSNQDIRTAVIINSLHAQNYDFVFMQEAFTESFRESVATSLKQKFPHRYYLDSDAFFFPYFGSGLFVLAKHPFKILDQVYFKKCADADCWAAKGSFLIESKLPTGKVVQFAVTHLQAGPEYKDIRHSQFEQIQMMLKKDRRPGVPQVLVGDLNTSKEESDFKLGATLLNMNHVELSGPIWHTNVIDCYKRPDHPKRWIDHVWIDRGTRLLLTSLMVREINYQLEGKTCVVSDHHAVEAILTFEN